MAAPDVSPDVELGISEVEGEGWIPVDWVWVSVCVRVVVESCSEEIPTETRDKDSVLDGK